MRNLYYTIKYGIRNLIRWFPVIWNDRDWDQAYIYELLHKKFEHMELLHRKHSYKLYSNKTADELRTAKSLCKRLQNNNYLLNALIEYHKKYGENDNYLTFEKLPNGGSKVVFTNNNEQRKMFKKAGVHRDYMEKQDIEYLFNFIKNHIQKWWD